MEIHTPLRTDKNIAGKSPEKNKQTVEAVETLHGIIEVGVNAMSNLLAYNFSPVF